MSHSERTVGSPSITALSSDAATSLQQQGTITLTETTNNNNVAMANSRKSPPSEKDQDKKKGTRKKKSKTGQDSKSTKALDEKDKIQDKKNKNKKEGENNENNKTGRHVATANASISASTAADPAKQSVRNANGTMRSEPLQEGGINDFNELQNMLRPLLEPREQPRQPAIHQIDETARRQSGPTTTKVTRSFKSGQAAAVDMNPTTLLDQPPLEIGFSRPLAILSANETRSAEKHRGTNTDQTSSQTNMSSTANAESSSAIGSF